MKRTNINLTDPAAQPVVEARTKRERPLAPRYASRIERKRTGVNTFHPFPSGNASYQSTGHGRI